MSPHDLPDLEERLSRPTPAVIDLMRQIPGDFIVLGAAGKMGPSLAGMIKRASDDAGTPRRVIAVSRFSSPGSQEEFNAHGIETVARDLLDANAVAYLPAAANVIYMAGMKFGATGNESLTWAMNAWLPGIVCERYSRSRIVAFSTGNVYGLVPVASGGSVETDPPRPDGEYAMTTLGRERMFQYHSQVQQTPIALLRLNYATELRYGVLVDMARDVAAGRPVDISMGHVNVIWLTDANAMTLAAFDHVAAPARIINLAGGEILNMRAVCEQFGRALDRTPSFVGHEGPDALLNNGHGGFPLLGQPQVDAAQMIQWTADWVARGGENYGKPTHFQTRSGKF